MKQLKTPVSDDDIRSLAAGDMVELSGYIYTGRDAVLPKILSLCTSHLLSEYKVDLQGSLIFHTAVSPAGIGPTSSNKLEIENSIPGLSEAGVKIHLGKGMLRHDTIEALRKFNSVYAVIPPVTALLESRIKEKSVIAFPEEGMEAFHRLQVERFPIIIAAAHGTSIYG